MNDSPPESWPPNVFENFPCFEDFQMDRWPKYPKREPHDLRRLGLASYRTYRCPRPLTGEIMDPNAVRTMRVDGTQHTDTISAT